MQLRQLRKAWVGDWEPTENRAYTAITAILPKEVGIWDFVNTHKPLSFPTTDMAKDFLSFFRDLCEKAKVLL